MITYTTGGAGLPTAAQDNGSTINYVESATYAPFGGLTGMINGKASGFNGITVTNGYSSRLQPILLSAVSPSATVFSDCFDFHLRTAVTSPSPCSFSASSVGNNGNVYQVVNNRDTTRTQAFTYDSLNRITSGQSSGTQWGENYTIDAWGNLYSRTQVSGKTNYEPLSVTALGNNQLSGFTYDAPGNLITNSPSTYKYDGENRLVTTGGYNYYYDGDGNRVAKVNGSTGTLYWRGPTGDPLSESSLTGTSQEEYIFFGGLRVARRDVTGSVVHYYFSDHLGSHAVVENATGNSCEQDIDYYPYGGVVHDYCGTVTQHYRFTGKERDTESGLDNFGARYYASSLGRFMIPDPAGDLTADASNPQSWNQYAYVLNNPLIYTDPTGLECVWDDGSYDSNDDPVTGLQPDGTHPGCEGNGGQWVDHSYFQQNGLPDWSGDPNSDIANYARNFTTTVNATAANNYPNVTAAPPQPPPLKPRCTGPALWAGAKAAGQDLIPIPPQFNLENPSSAAMDLATSKQGQAATIMVLYQVGNAARTLAPLADAAADFVPVVGWAWAGYQGVHAAYVGWQAYKQAIDQCYGGG